MHGERSVDVGLADGQAGGEARSGEIDLLRGRGYDLGPVARKFALEQRSMVRVLQAQARERPDHTWLVFDGNESLTFGAAHVLARRVAGAVRRDVGNEVHVALLLRNQVEFMPAFYGTMMAGGTAVPLNADARGPVLQRVIGHCDAEILIVRADLVENLKELEDLGAVQLVVVIGETAPRDLRLGVPMVAWDNWLGEPLDDPRLPRYDETAVLQYTSGTTGGPKGGIYPHHFLYLYAAIYADSWGAKPDDVLTTPLPLYHVAALAAVANVALHVGCTAHLKSRFSPRSFWDDAARDGATKAFLLGPMVALITKLVRDVPSHSVESVVSVPAFRPAESEKRFGVRVLWQAYGMTEVCPLPVSGDPLPNVPENTIGNPVSWCDYGVVDENDQLLGPGEVGELVFRPRLPYGMVAGYYKNAEATQRAFRNFVFHTGDLGAYDEDGVLTFHGRTQDRIRRRGENVSASDVEAVALRHDAVLEAAAYAVPSELGEDDIKLDIVLAESVVLEEFHAWLANEMPSFMTPRYLEVRDQFPKTPSERVRKFKLRESGVEHPGVFDAGDGSKRRRTTVAAHAD